MRPHVVVPAQCPLHQAHLASRIAAARNFDEEKWVEHLKAEFLANGYQPGSSSSSSGFPAFPGGKRSSTLDRLAGSEE